MGIRGDILALTTEETAAFDALNASIATLQNDVAAALIASQAQVAALTTQLTDANNSIAQLQAEIAAAAGAPAEVVAAAQAAQAAVDAIDATLPHP